MLRVLLPCLLAALLGGCAALQPPQDRLFQQNRFSELRQVMEAKLGTKPDAPTGDLVYLCFAYAKIRAYDKLFPCIERMETRIRGGDTKLYWFDFSAAPALLRAQAAIELADLPKAIEYGTEAHRLTQPKGVYLQMKIYALSVLSLAHALSGNRSEAERFAAELTAVDTGYPNTLMASDKYIGLARVQMALGDPVGAMEALRRDDAETGLFKGMADLVTGAGLAGDSIFSYWELPKRFIRARALLETGQKDAARQAYDALLASPGVEQNADLLWIILDDRGRLAEGDGDPAMAIGLYNRAIASVELQRATIRAEAGRIGFVGDKQALYWRMVSAQLNRGDVPQALAFAERAKARALVDLLGSRDMAATARSAPVGQLVTQLRQAQSDLAQVDPAMAGSRSAMVSSLTEQLRQVAPDLAALVAVSPLSAATLQGLLPDGEILVEYFGHGSDLVAFVAGKTVLTARRLDGKGLRADIQALRKHLERPDQGDPAPLAKALHARLMEPLADLLTGDRLLVVPHGPLHYLPFAALHDGRGFLVERRSIRILPAAGVMPYLDGRPVSSGKTLLVGNPDAGNPDLDLEFAQKEVEAIHKIVPGSTLLLRKEASKTAVKRSAANFSRLHFASHGKFRPDSPLASGLLLAREGDEGGMLTVSELYGLSLKADLVTLSACETGLGAIESGDDVVGLTRGFLFAGARTIVSSLWSVDDEATKDLMVGFYSGLAKAGKRDALRLAQMAVKAKHSHPYYWAAFQLTGDGR
ncbi:Tetratricopeptide repeat domain protein [Candidatus Terasakiella magnetica]|nr:Tetratricopeptide repeat domain protein [Candidatus Terasakiella magnetica]